MTKGGSLHVQKVFTLPASSRWSSLAARVEAGIDHRPIQAFALLTAFYCVVVVTLSSFKLMWLDELITLHISKLPSVAAIWNVLGQGADPNPPGYHVLAHLSQRLLGDRELAYRLPAVVGYWIGVLSLFSYLRNHLSATWALAGTIVSMCMAAFDYSYESRSYGLFYGLSMLAFFCWTRCVDPRRSSLVRWIALIGMTFALAAGISTNYFAVLAFFPVAGGEVVRTLIRANQAIRQRRGLSQGNPTSIFRVIDLRVWVAILIAAMPMLAYRPLIARAVAIFAPYAWNKVSMGQVSDSYTEMVEIVLYPILALFAVAAVVLALSPFVARVCTRCRGDVLPRWMLPVFRQESARITVPWHETAGILLFMAYPLLGYLIASFRGGMLSPRFVIPVCFGFAMAATLVAFWLFGNLPRAGLIFLCFVTAWFACRESYVGYWYEEQKQCFYKVLDRLPQAELMTAPDPPIVIPEPLLALTFQHYAPPEVANRIVFPVDFPAIRFYRHDDSPDENIWVGRSSVYHLRVMPLADYIQSTGTYLIIASDGNWLLDDLAVHRYAVEGLPIDTRAQAIGGFTPLARGTPRFYKSNGDLAQSYVAARQFVPIPFDSGDNLPASAPFSPPGPDR